MTFSYRLTTVLAASLLALPALAQQVKLATSQGDIVLQLNAQKAPETVANFVQYVKAGHYDGVVFHRVIDGFMIQTGGYTEGLKEKPTRKPIKLEASNGLANARGTVAMARTPDPNSARAQFFINVADNAFLDAANARDGNGYAVFGQVVQGMDVVDRIKAVPTTARGAAFANLPTDAVVIRKATLIEDNK